MHSCSAAHSFLYTGNDGKDKYVSNASYPSARREVNTQFIENHTEHCCPQHADHPRIFIPPSSSSYFGSCLHRQPKSRPPLSQSPGALATMSRERSRSEATYPTLYLLVCRVNISPRRLLGPIPQSRRPIYKPKNDPSFAARYVIRDELGSSGFGFVISATNCVWTPSGT